MSAGSTAGDFVCFVFTLWLIILVIEASASKAEYSASDYEQRIELLEEHILNMESK